MVWEKPIYAILFSLLLLMLYFLYKHLQWQQRAVKSFADEKLIPQVFEAQNSGFFKLKYLFLFLSIFFAVLALMGPKWGEEKQKLKREGIDLVFALDLSNSMNAQDIAPNRIEKSKKFITSFIQKLGGDRVGLVIFAGGAYDVSPLTSDYSAIETFVQGLSTDLIWNQGTDFSKALEKSAEIFDPSPNTSKAIILISDGEDHERHLNSSIDLLKKNNICVFTLGVGGIDAVPIPVRDEYGNLYYKEDENGNMILTSFHAGDLKNMAEKTGGEYLQLESIENTSNILLSMVNNLEKKYSSDAIIYHKKHQFQWFLGVSLLLLFIYTLTSDKKKLPI